MMLTLASFFVKDVVFGEKTRLAARTLVIEPEGLKEMLRRADSRIAALAVALARPGEATRILCVKDVVEPRCKVSGEVAGSGEIRILRNVAVVTCGKIVGFQEGIIDMRGPGSAHTPFARTLNVVLEVAVVPGLDPHQHEEAVRLAGQRAAAFLAEAARGGAADNLEEIVPLEPERVRPELPRVAYVYMLLSQGLLHDTYVFGQNAREGLPRLFAPHLLFDGVITSGNCVSACDKNTTFHHQNNPLLRELYSRHNRELNFVGVVLTNEPVRLAGKQASAAQAVALVRGLAAQAAVLSKEGFGNPDADQMMLIRGLEQAGIKTAGLTDEYAGPDGASQSLADSTPEADALVSVGNANERILLPPLARILGPLDDLARLAGAYPQSLKEDGSLEIELQGIIGATNQLGMQKLSCREV
ncbi:glycine/sarcosine/betaine reductase component B subunit [Thiovibrio sp. JS02]